ncbi:23S ribosomal RNA methyltransferase Erm [Patescibacteria group bacterium]
MEKDMDKGRQLWQSQNFLKRPEFVSRLVEMADISNKDLVVEIGPGKGVITRQLADVAEKVIAIELDPKLAKELKTQFQDAENVTIIEKDFFNWRLPNENYKVFSNIPFNMTADIIKRLTEFSNSPEILYLIMQDKALERFAGEKEESQISLLLKPWFEFRIVTNIERSEFNPRPNVNTVLAEIRKRDEPFVDPKLSQNYRDFIIFGFNQWKPTLIDAYGDIFSHKQKKIVEGRLKIKGKKPTELTFDQWLDLFKTYNNYVSDKKKGIIRGAEKRLEKSHKKHKKWHRTR